VSAGDASLAHLLGRLGALELRVAAAVERRRRVDPDPQDAFRGLSVSDADVDRLLTGAPAAAEGLAEDEAAARAEREADRAEAGGARLRLRSLAASFALAVVDIELLLVALAPDLDARFERLYGYLHDDVTRKRASIGLALELAVGTPAPALVRYRLTGGSPLVAGGLMEVEDAERPFLTRALRVPDRVTMYLLGDDHPDHELVPLLAPLHRASGPHAEEAARAVAAGCALLYLRDPTGTVARAVAVEALALVGRPALAVDLARLVAPGDGTEANRLALREARLRGAGLVAGPIETLADAAPAALRLLADAPWPTFLTGSGSWDPAWTDEVPLVLEVVPTTRAERDVLWRAAVGDEATDGLDPGEAAAQFRLGPEGVERAARAALMAATAGGRPLDAEGLRAAARAQNAAGLERLARRVTPRFGWDELVLPDTTREHLLELTHRARDRELVLDEWGLGASARGRGIAALFAGEPGTGKTMAAEVLAHALGLDLYTIDLATVVDKYVGETEKNLDRIFREAERVHGVLFFDEADAIFGKRSEVRDAHDRYANVEIAYLLQRMEVFDGIAILATNLRANLDDAFSRRLDAVVDFPEPDAGLRRELWERCLGPRVPRAPDLDLDFCAERFDLSGGNIRNIALHAAHLAAADGGVVGMAALIRGTAREYRKLGRLASEAEFRPYHAFLT